MAELAVLRPRPEWASLDLSARAATIALRLAGLLEATCTPESGASASIGFLRGWARTAIGGHPAPPRPAPIDQLAVRFELDGDERELLLLAGLPEEHEGLAGTFRALHPRAEPHPTAGLAAQLLAGEDGDRSRLRRLLTQGALVRNGLMAPLGAGPLFERSLIVADQLWASLHGHDAWPARVGRVAVADPPDGLGGWLRLPAVARAVHALRSPVRRTLL